MWVCMYIWLCVYIYYYVYTYIYILYHKLIIIIYLPLSLFVSLPLYNGFLWVSLGFDPWIPQKAMQNHSVVIGVGNPFHAYHTHSDIHPASWSFWFPFPFPLLAAGGTTSPCQTKGSTGYGETENQWKSRKSKDKKYEWIWQVFWLASLY